MLKVKLIPPLLALKALVGSKNFLHVLATWIPVCWYLLHRMWYGPRAHLDTSKKSRTPSLYHKLEHNSSFISP